MKNKQKGTQEAEKNAVLDFLDPKDTYQNTRNREAFLIVMNVNRAVHQMVT